MSSLTLNIIKNNFEIITKEFTVDKYNLSTIYQELSDFIDIQLQSFSNIDCWCIDYLESNISFLKPERNYYCCYDVEDKLDTMLLSAFVELLSEKVVTLTKEHNTDCNIGGKCYNIQENIDRINKCHYIW